MEHKLAGINYIVKRIATYRIPEQEKELEIQISQQIINENGYCHMDIAKLTKDRRSKNNIEHENNTDEHNKNDNRKWASFTYIGKEVIPITRVLKKFKIKVAFRTRNTLEKWLGCKQLYPVEEKGDKYDTCGIYKLNCRSCDGSYTGPTGRNFKTRFKEHVSDIKNNRCKTVYSKHILDYGHEGAHNITELEILEKQNKGPL
jgi:hypothetical protein